MKLRTKINESRRRFVDRSRSAFTLAEILAAMVFMAIVIPVALEGLSVASRAGDVAHRKILAARVAERLINETIINRQSSLAVRNGTSQEGTLEFRWTVRSDLWKQDTMRQISAEVMFAAQGHDYSVVLTTLMQQ